MKHFSQRGAPNIYQCVMPSLLMLLVIDFVMVDERLVPQ
jgi:hypothetical protein